MSSGVSMSNMFLPTSSTPPSGTTRTAFSGTAGTSCSGTFAGSEVRSRRAGKRERVFETAVVRLLATGRLLGLVLGLLLVTVLDVPCAKRLLATKGLPRERRVVDGAELLVLVLLLGVVFSVRIVVFRAPVLLLVLRRELS
jgi:hypothetical protein